MASFRTWVESTAGVVDGFSVGWGVAAVDAATGEVDADVALFEGGDPGAEGQAVPRDDAPRSGLWGSAEDCDVVFLGVEVAGEDLAYLSCASGDDDSHAGSLHAGLFALAECGRYLCHSEDSAICLTHDVAFEEKARM